MSDFFLRLHGIALAISLPAAIYFFYSLRYRSGISWVIRKRIALGVERAAQAFRKAWMTPPVAETIDVSIDPLGRCDVGDVVDYADGVHWRFDYPDLLGKRLTVRGHRVVGVADVCLDHADGYAYWARRGETSCLRCDAESPCVDWNEVDIGVGVQTFEPQYECPTHGRFAFVDRSIAEINAGVKPRAVYQADEARFETLDELKSVIDKAVSDPTYVLSDPFEDKMVVRLPEAGWHCGRCGADGVGLYFDHEPMCKLLKTE